MLGEYFEDALALRLFGAVMISASVMRTVLFAYAMRRPALLTTGKTPERFGLGLAIGASPILVYLIAMALAEVSATATLILYFSVPILYFLLVTALRDRRSTASEANEFS